MALHSELVDINFVKSKKQDAHVSIYSNILQIFPTVTEFLVGCGKLVHWFLNKNLINEGRRGGLYQLFFKCRHDAIVVLDWWEVVRSLYCLSSRLTAISHGEDNGTHLAHWYLHRFSIYLDLPDPFLHYSSSESLNFTLNYWPNRTGLPPVERNVHLDHRSLGKWSIPANITIKIVNVINWLDRETNGRLFESDFGKSPLGSSSLSVNTLTSFDSW